VQGHTHTGIFLIQIAFVPTEVTVPLGSKRMKMQVRQRLRRVRALDLEHLTTYDVRIAGTVICNHSRCRQARSTTPGSRRNMPIVREMRESALPKHLLERDFPLQPMPR